MATSLDAKLADAANTPDAVYRRVALRLIPFLVVCYVCAMIDRSNVGFAKLGFARDIGLSEAAYGLGGGLFYLGYCAFEVPSNMLLARIGARKTLTRIMLLWSLASASFAFVTEPWQFYGLRVLLGAAEAGFFPGVIYYLSFWAPAGQRARLTAYFMSAMAISGIVAGPMSGLIMQGLDGAGGLKGWQWLFLIEGAPGVLLAALAFAFLPDGPNEARWLTREQKQRIADDVAEDRASRPAPPASAHWTAALMDVRLLGLCAMAFALISTVGGLSLWLPTTIKQSGVESPLIIGLMSAAPYIFGVVVQQLVARSSDARGERRWHAAACTFLATAAWLLLPLVSGDPVLALACLTVSAVGAFGATAPFWSMPAAILPPQVAAVGIAAVSTVGGIGGFVSPIIVGRLADVTGSAAVGQSYFAAVTFIAAALLLLATRPRRTA